jgi:hypothetical protein
MQKCNFVYHTAWSGDRLSLLFGSIGAMSTVVTLCNCICLLPVF